MIYFFRSQNLQSCGTPKDWQASSHKCYKDFFAVIYGKIGVVTADFLRLTSPLPQRSFIKLSPEPEDTMVFNVKVNIDVPSDKL
jgi:hypothetical protein